MASLTVMMEQAALRPDNVPVTVVINWLIKPGKEQDFEEWLKGVDDAALKFPGYLGISVIPPTSAQPEYVMIFKFDLYSSLKRWVESKERKAWMERAKSLTQRDPNVEVLTGLENWFTLPDQAPPPKPPARHKMAIISALGIFPLIILLNAVLLPQIKTLPWPLPPIIMVGLISTCMTYLIMPRLTRLFYRWLYAYAEKEAKPSVSSHLGLGERVKSWFIEMKESSILRLVVVVGVLIGVSRGLLALVEILSK